jgi:hypothetical protein
MIKAFLGEHWIAIVLVVGALGLGFAQGTDYNEKGWLARWESRNAEESAAKAAFELKQRETERGLRDDLANQLEINDKQRLEGQRIKSDADAALNGLHGEISSLQLRLQRTGNASSNSSTISSVTRAAMVLTDLLASCSTERQDLAGSFDESRKRALNVEHMYDKARGQ